MWKKRSEVGHGVTEEDATAIRFEPAKRRRCGAAAGRKWKPFFATRVKRVGERFGDRLSQSTQGLVAHS